MALTDAQKRASAADIARRKALGDVKVTVWLSARAKVRLDWLTKAHGTRQKALEAALFAEVSRTATDPAKPASEPENRPSVVNKPDGVGVTVQLGPTRSAPGARQKSGKAKR